MTFEEFLKNGPKRVPKLYGAVPSEKAEEPHKELKPDPIALKIKRAQEFKDYVSSEKARKGVKKEELPPEIWDDQAEEVRDDADEPGIIGE